MNISAALGLSSDFRSDAAGEAFSVEVRRWYTGSPCNVASDALFLVKLWPESREPGPLGYTTLPGLNNQSILTYLWYVVRRAPGEGSECVGFAGIFYDSVTRMEMRLN